MPDVPFSQAVHEAGHAVTILLLGGHFDMVFIGREFPGVAGRHSGTVARIGNLPWQSTITVYLAGPIAETRYNEMVGRGRPADGRISNGDATDVADAHRLLADYDQPGDLAPHLERTTRIVTSPGVWDWITRTAAKLYARGHLSEVEVLLTV